MFMSKKRKNISYMKMICSVVTDIIITVFLYYILKDLYWLIPFIIINIYSSIYIYLLMKYYKNIFPKFIIIELIIIILTLLCIFDGFDLLLAILLTPLLYIYRFMLPLTALVYVLKNNRKKKKKRWV